MWLRPRVSAPAIMVDAEDRISSDEVAASSSFKLRVNCSSTMRNGRYLLVSGTASPSPFISMSPSASGSPLVFELVAAVAGVG